jgi:hypothetical protein
MKAGNELISVDDLDCTQASAREVRDDFLVARVSTVQFQVFREVERRYFDVSLLTHAHEAARDSLQ